MTYYIYGIHHDTCDYPLYMGMTNNPEQRYKQHLATNYPLQEKLKELRRIFPEIDPRLEIHASTEDIKEARKLELEYIQANTPLFNRQGNKEGVQYHQFIRLLNDMYFILEEAGLEDSKADNAIGKILHLVKKAALKWETIELINIDGD